MSKQQKAGRTPRGASVRFERRRGGWAWKYGRKAGSGYTSRWSAKRGAERALGVPVPLPRQAA